MVTNSPYRFTDPIRYFKANDPIYFEVENIPLKQIHENTLWLKDQITGGAVGGGGGGGGGPNVGNIGPLGLDRSYLAELKPYATGNDNVVRVNPGRFTARINDAYNLQKLQIIEYLTGDNNDLNTWFARKSTNASIQKILESFKNSILVESMHMNGLAERAFSYPAGDKPDRKNIYAITDSGNALSPSINTSLNAEDRTPYPLIEYQLWGTTPRGSTESYIIRQFNDSATSVGFASLGVAETNFIKRWRGVARTSIVDVPETLSIEIPAFAQSDFYYKDVNGVNVNLNSNIRIDLLFIYSKPIDTSSVTVAKFSGSQPTVITSPQLGLVHGAGIGIDLSNTQLRNLRATRPDGSLMILPCVSDQTDSGDSGFTSLNIKGSFPSPDDLMNLAPMLDETLSDDNYALIGQTVLPIAYIVVRSTANTNEAGIPLITPDDVIDIRPFFRTTELAYNERAGLAAAVPAPSLANPVVTQGEMESQIRKSTLTTQSQLLSETPRVVGGGYIKGGFWYGPEGTMIKRFAPDINVTVPSLISSNTNLAYNPNLPPSGNVYMDSYREAARQILISQNKIPADYQIPVFPEWDIAKWVESNNLPDAGYRSVDRMNIFQKTNLDNSKNRQLQNNTWWQSIGYLNNRFVLEGKPRPGSYYNYNRNFNQSTANVNTFYGASVGSSPGAQFSWWKPIEQYSYPGTDSLEGYCILFCKKTVQIDRSSVPWMGDYDVKVNFLYCAPIGTKSSPTDAPVQVSNIWVDKKKDSFTIYVSWPASDYKMGEVNAARETIALNPYWEPWNDSNAAVGTYDTRTEINPVYNPGLRQATHRFQGFVVLTDDFVEDEYNRDLTFAYPPQNTPIFSNSKISRNTLFLGESGGGFCMYPTVSFSIIGYPSSWMSNGSFLTNINTGTQLNNTARVTLK